MKGLLRACYLPLALFTVASQATEDRYLESTNTVTPAKTIEQVHVIGVTPVNGIAADLSRLPYNIQRAVAEDLDDAKVTSLTDYANQRLGSVSINSAQNNLLQPDLQFRGFTASPLLGLSQGLAVYQNGARLNEPLGDVVNWDLLPLSAVSELTLHGGTNPVFGLNSLGGSLAMTLKNGFNFTGHQLQLIGGSWGRKHGILEAGGNNGQWGFYVNADVLEEDGWRDLSASEAERFLASVSWRDGEKSGLNLTMQSGDSDLTGNGSAPVGLLATDRNAVFTAPDNTQNNLKMVTLDGFHFISDDIQLAGSAFWREVETESFNGDASELALCDFGGSEVALLEEFEELQELAEQDLDLELDDYCEGVDPGVTNVAQLEALLESTALGLGLDPEDYELDDITDEFAADAILSDEAVNNMSQRDQSLKGFDLQISFLQPLWGYDNSLIVGIGHTSGDSRFESETELSFIDPNTRSTEGLGTGAMLEDAEVSVDTSAQNSSIYFSNTTELNQALTLTLAGRFNRTDVTLNDLSGERPELNGKHRFSRFNPSVALSYQTVNATTFYAGYSQSSRAPTPIELACNEGVFQVAREFAIARGDDPDDIDFECRLPNAFLADPPLQQVVAKSFELGVRGSLALVEYSINGFHTTNNDDILFQSTGRATGLFANVDKTRRAGLEFGVAGGYKQFDWSANYAWIDATFETELAVLSPNHPEADDNGEIHVQRGDRIPGIAEHQFKLLGQYRPSDFWSVALEMVHNSDQFLRGDESNQMDSIGGYTVYNASIAYQLNQAVRLFARVDNLFDKEYENFGVIGEDPTEVIAELDNDSPVFWGPGAPRAAWLGIQIGF